MDNSSKKTKLLLGMLIAIILILLVGIVFQFVSIKHLQKKVEQAESSSSACVTCVKNSTFLCDF